jgi:hypothetical protein
MNWFEQNRKPKVPFKRIENDLKFVENNCKQYNCVLLEST